MNIRALIVDDEPLARDRLRLFLAEEPGVEVIGECANGREAVAAIGKESPDLVFLDVQMPELDGFGVLAQLDAARRPAVIFVTAYDQFALRAFDVHAVDYLLKPYDRERFQTALRRALEQLKPAAAGDWNRQLSALLADLKAEPKALERIAVKSSGRVVLVRIADIDWIEAADNYVELHVGTETHLHRETMNAMEGQLPAEKFLRISRSTIVNLERVKELQPLFHGEYAVLLRGGARLTASRTYRDRLDPLLGDRR